MLDGVFHADVQGRRRDPRRRPAMGRPAGDHGRRARRAARRARRRHPPADARPGQPHVGRRVRRPRRARARARCATCSRAEMWEAINAFHLGLLQQDLSAALSTGPYSVYAYVKERCGAVLGRHQPDDAARRGRTPSCGRRPDRGRRHGAADAPRRAPGRAGGRRRCARPRRAGARAAAGRRRLPGLPARRARAAERLPRHALPALRAGVSPTPWRRPCRCCTTRSPRRRRATATPPPCSGSAGCGPTSTSAPVRSTASPAIGAELLEHVSASSPRSTPTSPSATSAARAPVPRLATV